MNNTFGLVGTIDMNTEIAMDLAKRIDSVFGKPVNWIKKILGYASALGIEVKIKFNNNDEWYYDENQRSLSGTILTGKVASLELESPHYMKNVSPLYWFESVEEWKNRQMTGEEPKTRFRIEQVEWIVLA
jgi:hypothetical protein